MPDTEERELYAAALKTYGHTAQLLMVVEECSELSTAVLHTIRQRDTDLLGEIADVQIMLNQLLIMQGDPDGYKVRYQQKLDRLKQHLDRDNPTWAQPNPEALLAAAHLATAKELISALRAGDEVLACGCARTYNDIAEGDEHKLCEEHKVTLLESGRHIHEWWRMYNTADTPCQAFVDGDLIAIPLCCPKQLNATLSCAEHVSAYQKENITP